MSSGDGYRHDEVPARRARRRDARVLPGCGAEGHAEGVTEGRAQDIERLLDKRRIAMTAADREKIVSCRDCETLDTWLDRVLTISDISELFAD